MKVLISILFFNLSSLLFAFGISNVEIERLKKNADYIIRNKSELIKALQNCPENSVLYIKGNSEINLTGLKSIEIRKGLKILGDRNVSKGKRGTLLYTRSAGIHPLFEVIGDNVFIYGLRLRGDDGNVLVQGKNHFKGKSKEESRKNYLDLYRKNMYATPVSSGIATNKNNLVIDNCELYQWTYTAVYIKKGAKNVNVKNSYIHHNQRFGLGYGVTVDQGEAIIELNTFNYNRHSIASTGRAGSNYIVRNNTFYADGNDSWAVDMHGGNDRADGTSMAGESIVVRDNVFYLKGKGQAVVIRGKPTKLSLVENNKVYRDKDSKIKDSKVFEQVNEQGNLKIQHNIIQ